MCGFNGIQRGNYLRGETIRRNDVEARVGKLKNGKHEDIGKMVKGVSDMVVDWT